MKNFPSGGINDALVGESGYGSSWLVTELFRGRYVSGNWDIFEITEKYGCINFKIFSTLFCSTRSEQMKWWLEERCAKEHIWVGESCGESGKARIRCSTGAQSLGNSIYRTIRRMSEQKNQYWRNPGKPISVRVGMCMMMMICT